MRPAEASDLTRLNAARLHEKIAAAGYGGGVEAGGAGPGRRFDPALGLLGLLGLVLCGEALFARRGLR